MIFLPRNFGKPEENEYYVNLIAVRESFQNRSIAKKFLESIEKKAKKLGFKKLSTDVRANNEPAKHLFQSFGFKITGVKKPIIFKSSLGSQCRMVKNVE
jgi:ribosomal protein S18 acetylase RimI-like enzyme